MDVHDLGLRVKNHVATNSVFVLLDKDAGRPAKSATNFPAPVGFPEYQERKHAQKSRTRWPKPIASSASRRV